MSISISTGVRYYLGIKSDGVTILVRLILPFVIAFPIALVLFSAIEGLRERYRALLREIRELSKKANTDPLTGLLNRRSFEEQYDAAAAHKSGGSFIVVDMDYLKVINDKFGHTVGDDAIISVAHALESVLGDECIIARIGGDEFCAYLPDGQAGKADQLRVAVNDVATGQFRSRSTLPKTFPLCVSIGVQKCATGLTFREMVAKADADLYRKKRSRPKPRENGAERERSGIVALNDNRPYWLPPAGLSPDNPKRPR